MNNVVIEQRSLFVMENNATKWRGHSGNKELEILRQTYIPLLLCLNVRLIQYSIFVAELQGSKKLVNQSIHSERLLCPERHLLFMERIVSATYSTYS